MKTSMTASPGPGPSHQAPDWESFMTEVPITSNTTAPNKNSQYIQIERAMTRTSSREEDGQKRRAEAPAPIGRNKERDGVYRALRQVRSRAERIRARFRAAGRAVGRRETLRHGIDISLW